MSAGRDRRLRQRRTARALTLEFLFQNLFSYAAEGVVLTGLALWLGATTLQIGLLGSIGGFGFTAVLAAPWLVRAARGSRRAVMMAVYAIRLCSRIGILALLFVRPPDAVWWLVGLAGAARIAAALYAPLSRAWISSAVPPAEHSRFLSTRLSVAMIGAVAAPPLAGAVVDALPGTAGFALAFGAGLVFGTVALWLLSAAHDPSARQPEQRPVRGQLARSLRFGPFRRMYLFQTAAAFADGLAGSFLDILYLKYLGLSFFLINALVAASKGAKGLSAFANRWLQKHHEPLPLFRVSVVAMSLAPLLLIGAAPGAAALVAAALILQEAARGVMSPAEQTLMMRWGTAGDQTGDFTLIFFSRGVVSAFTPLLAAALLRAGFGLDVQADAIDPQPIHVLIAAGAALKLLALSLMPWRGGAEARDGSR